MIPGATAPGADGWFGYPRAAWLIIGVEAWERFSFYSILSLLILFLTGDPAHGGFGWKAADALSLLGIYSGAMYAFPALGGYLADRILGRRRAIGFGLAFMLTGQVLLMSPAFLPAFWGAWRHAPLLGSLRALGVPLGFLHPTLAITTAIQQSGARLDPLRGASWLRQAYALASVGFYTAIFFLILGNALMKSSLVVLCGEAFSPTDPRREGAYAYYYLGIALGAVVSGMVVGVVAQAFGWYWGFMTGTVGVLVALGTYLGLAPRWLRQIGVHPDRPERRGALPPAAERAQDGERGRRIALLAILASLLCVFSTGWFQLFGTWSLFIETFVDRSVGPFVVPVPWFGSLDAAVAICFAPLLAALWVRLATTRIAVDIVQKYVFALATAAIAHVLMFVCSRHATVQAPGSLWFPFSAVTLLAIGELVAWTSTYAVVSRAAPSGLASMTMGIWYMLTLGLGGYLSGATGRIVNSVGFSATFALVAALMGGGAIATFLLRRPILRLAERAGIAL